MEKKSLRVLRDDAGGVFAAFDDICLSHDVPRGDCAEKVCFHKDRVFSGDIGREPSGGGSWRVSSEVEFRRG
jgi:hypothetical protein